MQNIHTIENAEQAITLFKPLRLEMLKRMDEPRTCPELAEYFGESPQKIYYHVKALEKAGLVEKVKEQKVRGIIEGHYQAKARSYWLAPKLVGQVGGKRTTEEQMSLRVLLSLAEEVQNDVGRLGRRSEAGQDVASLSLSAQIHLPEGERRAEFLQEVQAAFQALARKYGQGNKNAVKPKGESFRLVLACYPKH